MLIRLLLIILLFLPAPTWAARLFTSGFEENDLTATMWTSAGAGASIVTTTPHSGTYAGKIVGGGGGTAITRNLATSLGEGTTLYEDFYWRTNNAGVANSRIFSDKSNTAAQGALITKLSTGVIRLTNQVPGTPTTVDSSLTVSVNTYYRFELEHVISDTVGTLTLRIYVGDSNTISETLVLNGGGSGEDTMPGNINQFELSESANSASLTYLFDDVAVNDAATSDNNSWPGNRKIALVKPASDTAVAWTKGGSAPAGTNFGGVAEVPGAPDDGTTYNFDAGTTNEDRLGITALPAEVPSNATLLNMNVYARASASASSGTLVMKVWDDTGAGVQGPSISVTSTTWRILTTNEFQIRSLAGKTKSQVDSYSIGYKATTGAVEKRVTSLWANVEWIESSGANSLMLLGVGK